MARRGIGTTLFRLGMFGILWIFPVLLVLPIPAEIGLATRRDFLPVFAVTLAVFYLANRLPEHARSLTTLVLTVTLFALTLSGVWRSGASELNNVAGLLPFSDAERYYLGAVRFLQGELLLTTVGRPLYPAALATVLGLASGNLQVAIAFFVLLNAVASFLAVREVQRSHGWMAGALVFLLLFFFYRRFSGTTLTENLAFALGATGFAATWRAVGEDRTDLFLVGVFLLSFGMSARPGALLVLPALLLWQVTRLKGQPLVARSSFVLKGILAAALGFAPHVAQQATILDPRDRSPIQISRDIFYARVEDMVGRDHPRVASGPEGQERAPGFHVTVLEALRSDPGTVISGLLRPWRASRLFSFVIPLYPRQRALVRDMGEAGLAGLGTALRNSPYDVLNLAAQRLFYVMLYGSMPVLLVVWWRRRQDPHSALVVWALLATLLCIPFVPPWIADDMRLYAVTIPFLAMVPTVALVSLTSFRSRQEVERREPIRRPLSALLVGVGGGLVAFLALGPFITRAYRMPEVPQSAECGKETSRFLIVYSPGSYVTLTDAPSSPRTAGLEIRADDFRRELAVFGVLYSKRATLLSSLGEGWTIVLGWSQPGRTDHLIAFRGGDLPRAQALVTICGKVKADDGEIAILESVSIPAESLDHPGTD